MHAAFCRTLGLQEAMHVRQAGLRENIDIQVLLSARSPTADVAARRYHIRAFSDVHVRHIKRWRDLWDHLEKYCWVVSWNSAHQLDTLACLRLKRGMFYQHHNMKAGCSAPQQVMHLCWGPAASTSSSDCLLHEYTYALLIELFTCAHRGAGTPCVLLR